MKKIVLLFLFIFFLLNINSTFGYNEEYKNVFIYKNILIENAFGETKTLNGNSFTGIIIVDENGYIIHNLTEKGDDVFLDNNKVDLNGEIWFLNDGGYLIISEFSQGIYTISYNGDVIYEGIYSEFIAKYSITTKIDKAILNYFIYDDKYIEVLFIGRGIGINFINKEYSDQIYDITCNDENLNIYYNGKNVLNTRGIDEVTFPTMNAFGANTFLNINGEQYFLNDHDINGISINKCSISSDNSIPTLENAIEVTNSEIIENVKKNGNTENYTETISGFYKINFLENLYYYNEKVFNYNGETFFFSNWKPYTDGKNLLFYVMRDGYYEIYLNMENIYKGEKDLVDQYLKDNYSDYTEVSKEDIGTNIKISLEQFINFTKNFDLFVEDYEIKELINSTILTKKYSDQKEQSKKELMKLENGITYIYEIDKIISKLNKDSLKKLFDKIQNLDKKHIIIDYLEAEVYLKLYDY